MGKAAELAKDEFEDRLRHVAKLNLVFDEAIRDYPALIPEVLPNGWWRLPGPDFRVNGGRRRSSYIHSLSFAGIEGETLLIELDRAGFCCSAGAACSSKNTEPSPVLKAFGVPDEYIRGTIRVSFSHYNTEESTYQLATEIRRIVTKLRELR
jgi:cysteine desulfurase